MKVISFLGINKYSRTRYVWNQQEKETEFFAEAMANWIKPEEILICLTPTAHEGEKSGNWQELKRRFERDGVNYRPLAIPEGHSEAELWEIFNVITNTVEENEEVFFDITNSFRSLPFLSFLAVTYLKAAKNVDVKGILYGAWDARDSQNRSPVFDLTPFLSLLDWLTATDQFLYTGNALQLATQLRNTKSAPLEPLAQAVRDIAMGLDLLRPRDVSLASEALPRTLRSVESGLPKPFRVVVQRLEEAYSQFGYEKDADPVRAHLISQLRMVNWYHERQHAVHTLALAREWMVSLLCAEYKLDMWDKDERYKVEFLLSGGMHKDSTGQVIEESPYLEAWKKHPHRKRLSRLWAGQPFELAKLRNDVLHTGFRKNPQPAQEIMKQTERIVQEINEIAAFYNLV